MQTFRKMWNPHDLQCNFVMLKQQFSAKDLPSLKHNLISVFLNLGLEYSFLLLNYLLMRPEVFHLSEPLLPICKRQKQRALPFCIRCLSVCVLNQSHAEVGSCNWDVMGNWVRGRISSWSCWKWRSRFLSKDAQLNRAISVKRETVKASTSDIHTENAAS